MTDTLIITDEHGCAGRVTRQELLDRCARLRASKLLQWHLIGDSSPLLNQIQGYQPAHEQDDETPMKDWTNQRLLRYWSQYRPDYMEMLANGELIGSGGGNSADEAGAEFKDAPRP